MKATSAVGPLMDVLRNDKKDDVRKSAAWALAEIGDPTALDYLEKTAQFDDSVEVRAAARTAQQRLLNQMAAAVPMTGVRTEIITESAVRPIASTPVPHTRPLPAASPMTLSEARQAAVASQPPAPPAHTDMANPFFNPAPSVNEPPLRLSPPVAPLEVP